MICVGLYIAVCLVITGMVPYAHLGEEAPLANAFTSKGLKYVSVLISCGAIAGLTTTLLVGLYVQVNLVCSYVSVSDFSGFAVLISDSCSASLGYISDLEETVYYQLYLPKSTQCGKLQSIHKFGLVLLLAFWQVFLMFMCSHTFSQLDPW